MPLTATIDPEHRRVVTTVTGRVSKDDFMRHIGETWADPGVAGFDELIDLTAADVSAISSDDIQDLASSGVSVDIDQPSRLALCVSGQLAFGLGRMYGALRESRETNVREIGVFHDLASALAWLDTKAC